MTEPRNAWLRIRWWVGGVLCALLLAGGIGKALGWNPFHRPLMRVAYNQFPPYLDKGPNGVPVGFAAQMFVEAAQKAKVDIKWVEIHGSADQAFSEGKADIYPLMTITPEREELFYMSAPWWENQFALISTEGRAIPDAAAAKGKVIATRIGVVEVLSKKLFPGARFINIQTLEEMEQALCTGQIDGFFSDLRLLQGQLLRRTKGCAGQELHLTSIPDSKLLLGTASTKAAAYANDRIFREIAKLALDGTLSRNASDWGIYTPYDTARLRQVVRAESRERLMAWGLLIALIVLTVSMIQTGMIRMAKRAAESAQAEAKEFQYRFDEFMKHTPAVTFIKDKHGRVVYSNEGPAASFSAQLTLRDEEVFERDEGVEVTETVHNQDGENRHFLVLKFPFSGASGSRLLGGVALDVTARILAERELEHHAKSDILTGLPNRRSFMAELDRAIERSIRENERLAVGFLDLDGFKRVNDVMGHEAGDELLIHVATRLRRFFRKGDMIARLGGDEFTFFFSTATQIGIQKMMAAIQQACEERFRIRGKEVLVSASIGVSIFPEHGSSSQQILRNADSAMYSAKRNGKRRVEFWSRPHELEEPGGQTQEEVVLSAPG